jgi:tetrahydromethanopterin S-methyltransferase subunit F
MLHRLVTRYRANQVERDAGATVIETVIIAAGFAALAIAVVAAIVVLVNGKVAGISL